MARNMMSLPIKFCEEMPNVMLDTRTFIEIARSNQEQLAAQNIQIQSMSTQIKVQNQLIRDLIALTKESLDRNPAPREVEVYQEIIPCFVNIMKAKLDGGDVSQVAYEWYTNATEQSWLDTTSEFKKDHKHYFKRIKCGVDIFALFIGEKISKRPKLRKEILSWKKSVLELCTIGRTALVKFIEDNNMSTRGNTFSPVWVAVRKNLIKNPLSRTRKEMKILMIFY
jgi:hypothetical protein